MTKTQPDKDASRNSDRRSFISNSLAAASGGVLLRADGQQKVDDKLSDEISVAADSLVLYTGLLDDIENTVRNEKLERMALEKAVGSGRLKSVIDKAVQLDSKYRTQPTLRPGEREKDFNDLLRLIKDTELFRYQVEIMSRITIPELEKLPGRIGEIRAWMMLSSALLSSSKPKEADEEITKAIRELRKLAGDSPAETNAPGRLILLLEGVRSYIGASRKSHHADKFVSHEVLSPSANIDEILRRYLNPARWYRMITAKLVVYPALVRSSDAAIRENLLKDGLRLVPGLRPPELEEAARELAKVTF